MDKYINTLYVQVLFKKFIIQNEKTSEKLSHNFFKLNEPESEYLTNTCRGFIKQNKTHTHN